MLRAVRIPLIVFYRLWINTRNVRNEITKEITCTAPTDRVIRIYHYVYIIRGQLLYWTEKLRRRSLTWIVKCGILNVSEDPPYDSLGNSAKTVQPQWPLASRIPACFPDIIAPLKSWLANWDSVHPKATVTQIIDRFPQHVIVYF